MGEDELRKWSESASRGRNLLQVLQSNGLSYTSEEVAEREAYFVKLRMPLPPKPIPVYLLDRQAPSSEAVELTRDVKLQVQRGCGIRSHVRLALGGRPNLLTGDIVYSPEPFSQSHPAVAVVTRVHRIANSAFFSEDGSAEIDARTRKLPTGRVDMLMWDSSQNRFSAMRHDVPRAPWEWLPPSRRSLLIPALPPSRSEAVGKWRSYRSQLP